MTINDTAWLRDFQREEEPTQWYSEGCPPHNFNLVPIKANRFLSFCSSQSINSIKGSSDEDEDDWMAFLEQPSRNPLNFVASKRRISTWRKDPNCERKSFLQLSSGFRKGFRLLRARLGGLLKIVSGESDGLGGSVFTVVENGF